MNDTVFINMSNHPSSGWGESQMNAARSLGRVVDLPFPVVDPGASEFEVECMARRFLRRILEMKEAGGYADVVVHIMGEMTLTFALCRMLQREGIPAMASTTAREVRKNDDGSRTSFFRFVQFRPYPCLD